MGNALIVGSGASGTTLLWTNPSPTSSFASQTISLDLKDYTFVAVELIFSASTYSGGERGITILPKLSITSFAYVMLKNGNNLSAIGRQVTSITDTSISFGSSLWNGETSADRGIPTRIWGIR